MKKFLKIFILMSCFAVMNNSEGRWDKSERKMGASAGSAPAGLIQEPSKTQASERKYTFKSLVHHPIRLLIEQTQGMGGEPRPSFNIPLEPNVPYDIYPRYFIDKITITDEKTQKSYTWHSRMSGKGETDVSEQARRYYGYDGKLNRGGKYEIVGANDESKFDHDNNKL